jgi:hypothetical protein|tara:strand:+ start:1933 stop:2616 length:684 start_codon:yes stop_codon:yes gene_type:complete
MFLPKVFIHIPKNAGMTIRRSDALRDKIMWAGPQVHKSSNYTAAVKSHMDSIGDHHGYEHARWRDLNPSIVNANGSFAVIRNPWDRVVSRYFFAKKVIEVEKKEPVGKHKVDSFEHFLEERFEWGDMKYMWHRAIRGWYPAYDYVTDKEGNIKPDILRFENLNSDLCFYFNIPEMTRARNVTALNPGTYKDLYTPETIQIVADWYAKDIETFGYDFDTGPTKNYWNA